MFNKWLAINGLDPPTLLRINWLIFVVPCITECHYVFGIGFTECIFWHLISSVLLPMCAIWAQYILPMFLAYWSCYERSTRKSEIHNRTFCKNDKRHVKKDPVLGRAYSLIKGSMKHYEAVGQVPWDPVTGIACRKPCVFMNLWTRCLERSTGPSYLVAISILKPCKSNLRWINDNIMRWTRFRAPSFFVVENRQFLIYCSLVPRAWLISLLR